MKLTDYESGILYLAKGHYTEEAKALGLKYIDIIYALRLKYYLYDPRDPHTLVRFCENLIELCFKLNLFSTARQIQELAGYSFFDMWDSLPEVLTANSINNSIAIKMVFSLLSKLARLKVQEKVGDEWIPIIEMTEKDSSFLQEYVDFLGREEE